MKTKIISLLFAIIASVCNLSAETIEWRDWTTPSPSGTISLMLNEYNKTATVVENQFPTTQYNYIFRSVEIPSSVYHSQVSYDVTSIDIGGFRNSPNLVHASIPNSVTSLGPGIFNNCGSLLSIEIPSSVTSIEGGITGGCSSLSSIIVDIENMVYDSRDNCNALIKTASNTLINGCKNTIIPNSVTCIRTGAFAGSGLTSISIPNSVTSILGSVSASDTIKNPFTACKLLTSIIVEEGNSTYDSRDNCNAIIETTSNKIIAGCNTTCIPNSVTSIGARAFYESGITSLTITDSVTSIGYQAFYGCTCLTSVTSMAIIPPTCKAYVFDHVECSQIPLYVPEESINAYKAAPQWKKFNPILPIGSSLESIEKVTEEKESTKLLRDGQVIILNGNKEYTITGNEL